MNFSEYAGMSADQASREAERLIADARTGGWFGNFDRLTELKAIIERVEGRVAA